MTRDRLLYEEALRVLNRRTGCLWGDTIEARVDSGVVSQRCPDCYNGQTLTTYPLGGTYEDDCRHCNGSGEILVER